MGGVPGDRAAPLGFHIQVDAAVTEDVARGGQHRGVRTNLPAERAACVAGADTGVL